MFRSLKKVFRKKDSPKLLTREKESFGNCPICRGKLVERKGPYGKFLGCSRYPNCTYSKNLGEYWLEKAMDDEKVIKNYLTMISGKRRCPHCDKMTIVSGLALTSENFLAKHYPQADLISWTGYDIYIVPWGDVFKQLPDNIQRFVLHQYAVKLTHGRITNCCQHCGKNQGNYYVYHEEGKSPFSTCSSSSLILDKVSLKNQEIKLLMEATDTISPHYRYMSRTQVRELEW